MTIYEARAIADIDRIVAVHEDINDAKKIRQTLEKEFGELNDNRIIFVGTINNIPVGTVQLLLKNADNDLELANGANIAHVHHLHIHPKHRNSGNGKELMMYIEEVARARGVKELTLGVDESNTNAVEFYHHLGYQTFKEVEGRKPSEIVLYQKKKLQ